jgi:1-acyl-sn-glycerol-3-phosphate acyltransferase
MAEESQYSIPYPRNVFKRTLLKVGIKIVLKVLARVDVTGLENIPKEGPLLLAGNHVGSIETALMAVYSPRLVEFLAAGDLPLDPQTQFASDNYGFIAVNRGNLDRKSVRMALDVLAQNGVLGIFPEGGTWEPGRMPAQIGVALLSQRGNAPVVPLGMSGIYGALGQALKLKRPVMKVRFGKPIPAFTSNLPIQDLKEALKQHADFVLKSIYDLIDETDKARYPDRVEYSFVYSNDEIDREGSDLSSLQGGDDVARMLMSDVILETYSLNLKMPVKALYPSEGPVKRADFVKAIQSILDLLKQNPGFLSYRYGSEVADRQVNALHALIDLLSRRQPIQITMTSVSTFKDGHQETINRDYKILAD